MLLLFLKFACFHYFTSTMHTLQRTEVNMDFWGPYLIRDAFPCGVVAC